MKLFTVRAVPEKSQPRTWSRVASRVKGLPGAPASRQSRARSRTRMIVLDRMHMCAYSIPVSFEWDPDKAEANRGKHGVDFADAVAVLHDDFAINSFKMRLNRVQFEGLEPDAIMKLKHFVENYSVCMDRNENEKKKKRDSIFSQG